MNHHASNTMSPAFGRSLTRRVALARIGAGGLAVVLGAARGYPVHARQDPSMPPGAVGITPQPLGSGLPAAAPGYGLGLTRLLWEPGATLNAHTHPGASVLYIESGTLTYTLLEGTATVTRAPTDPATPGAAEPLAPGDVVLEVGDALFEDADVIHTARSDSDEPTVVLIAGLLKADEPVSTFLEGTPTP